MTDGLFAWLASEEAEDRAFSWRTAIMVETGEKIWLAEAKKLGASDLAHLYFQMAMLISQPQISKTEKPQTRGYLQHRLHDGRGSHNETGPKSSIT